MQLKSILHLLTVRIMRIIFPTTQPLFTKYIEINTLILTQQQYTTSLLLFILFHATQSLYSEIRDSGDNISFCYSHSHSDPVSCII